MTINDLLMFTQIDLTTFNIMFETKDESLSSILKQFRVSKQDLHDTLWKEFNIPGMEVCVANTALDYLIECCENQKDLKDTLVEEIRKDILMSSIYYTNVAPNAVNAQSRKRREVIDMRYTVCLLFNENCDKVLLQRKDRTDYAGKWNSVGGKLEKGENTKQCALREIKEETGVDESELREFFWLGNLILPYDCGCDDEVCHLSFWAGIVDENLVTQQPGESEKLEWWSYGDIISLRVDNDILAGDGNLLYYIYWAKSLITNSQSVLL